MRPAKSQAFGVVAVLGVLWGANAQLPSRVDADLQLRHMRQIVERQDHTEGYEFMEDNGQRGAEQHGDAIPEFYLRHGQVALLAGSPAIAGESAERYLRAVGAEGEYYEEALTLLEDLAKVQDQWGDHPHCDGDTVLISCWGPLGAERANCHFWVNFMYWNEASWSGRCVGGLAVSHGVLRLVNDIEGAREERRHEGTMSLGKREGTWRETNANVDEAEGAYVNNVRQGPWQVTASMDGTANAGRIQRMTYVDGVEHGTRTIRWPSGEELTLPYVNGLIVGRSIRTFADGSELIGEFVHSIKEGVWTRYRSNGSVLQEETYLNGELHGPWRRVGTYCVSEGTYSNGSRDGTWKECSFRKESEGTYVGGIKQGLWVIGYFSQIPEGLEGILFDRHQDGVGTEEYVDGKRHGTSRYRQTYVAPNITDWTDCYSKSKETWVDGKRHGVAISRNYACSCFRSVYENGERVSRKSVPKRSCRRELDG